MLYWNRLRRKREGSFASSRLCRLIAISFSFAFLIAAQPALAGEALAAQNFGDALGLSPHWKWKQLETEHFRLNYPEQLSDVAQKAGNYFEQAHAVLSPVLKWEPRTRVQVVLVDNTDAANGMATPVLRFGIVLMMTPPDPWFTTSYYDDWLKLLIVHEYTHFLNMDATDGLWSPLRSVLGDVLLPNSIWPSWMLEGLAVYMETLFTKAGRGRSPYYDMVLRSAVDAGVFGTSQFVPLDRINGPNPYFPGGETAYLFGYQLMNRVAAGMPGPDPGVRALGELSDESSRRVPFFINMNLENVTGKTWYSHWDSWIEDTRRRIDHQLDRIRSRPETRPQFLTEGAYQVLGPALSPDGNWLAFTMETYEKRMGLHLRDQRTGKIERVADKRLGSQIAFTPDSKRILFSSLEVQSLYSQFSDLAYYDLERKRVFRLSHTLRARDPDVSPDGRAVVFTLTQNAVTGLAWADLIETGGELKLGTPEVLFMPKQYDRVANPRFSRAGDVIYFSLHPNDQRDGKTGSDIAALDLKTRAVQTLVSDGHFNRFPSVSPAGELHFISDATGVDNLYRQHPGSAPELVTNVATAVHFPAFGQRLDVVYGSVFSHTGSDLAELKIGTKPIDKRAVSIDPAPAPLPAESAPVEERTFPVSDYSVFPSIWPRQWFPLLYLEPRNVYLGAQILGFDAVDRHRYVLGLAYNTVVDKPDLLAIYTNRSLGPTITLSGEENTPAVYVSEPFLDFVRRNRFSASISYPLRRTYSTWVPALALELDRSKEYQRGADDLDRLVYRSRYVPHFDFRLSYANSEFSRLAVSAEGGRQAFAGSRVYFDTEGPVWKALLMDREFVRIKDHVVWSPSVKFTWTSSLSDHLPANALVRGRSLRLFDPLPSDNFDQLAIRGYPRQPFYSRAAGVLGQELWFPVKRVFRGWGTNPFFLEQVSGFVFGETAYFPSGEPGLVSLPSAGAGLKLDAQIFVQVPLTATLEYHRGFREDFGGGSEVFVTLGLGAFSF